MGQTGFNIEQSQQETVQSSFRGMGYANPISLLMVMSKTNDLIAPWWSRRRDIELRNYMHSSDHLSGAMYNMSAKMTAIPFRVEARDKSIKTHVELARLYTDLLGNATQFGDGWESFMGMFVQDLFGQDNGAFAEVIGPGSKDGPITGMPYSIAHLDSGRCTRTGNPEYPVLYEAEDGKLYKLHYTRVMFASQMPSTNVEMFGVGFCAVSRVLNASQNLMDIAMYKQEKLGSRPPRQMMITGGGLDPEDIQTAVQYAERSMGNVGLSRFAKTIVAGNRMIPDPKLQVIDMASIPDGFDEKESTTLGMAVIAMGFGMDARELFPAMESGATKADAIVQHLKQRGKGPGQTIAIMEKLIDMKVLPPFLRMVFDYQDDAQDRQAADIWNIRAQARQRDMLDKVTNVRIEREKMLENSEITEEQFEYLELEDGRLIDGTSVEVLFYSKDKDYVSMLSGATEANYKDKAIDIMTIITTSRDIELVKKARRALAALMYKFETLAEQELMRQARLAGQQQLGQQQEQQQDQNNSSRQTRQNAPLNTKPDTSYQEEKYGRKIGSDPTRVNDQQGNI